MTQTGRWRRAAMLALALALGAAAALMLAGPGYRTGWWALGTAFTVLRWAAYGGAAAALVALAALVMTRPRSAPRAFRIAAAAFLIGAVTFAVPFAWQRTAAGVPAIHDITTDTVNPPGFSAIAPLRADAPNSLEYTEEKARRQREGYPDVAPLVLPVSAAEAFDAALEAVQDAGWEVVAADREARRLEATDTTFWFGFKDDIAVRVTPVENGSRVDVRSISRVGRGDAGTNARRIRRYLASVRERI